MVGWARRWARSPSIRGRCAATTSTIPTSCASTSTRSRAPTSPTPCASPATRASCSRPRLRRLPEDLGRPRDPHLRADRAAVDVHRRAPRGDRLRPRARAALPGEVTTKWWKEERGERIFVDYNQNARDRTIASAYSIRPKPGAPVSAPLDVGRARSVQPEDFTVATMPARFAEIGDRHAAIDDVAHSLQPLLDIYEEHGERRHALPARLPEDAGRAQARPALARPRPPALTALRRLRQLLRPLRRVRGRRHDRADVAVGRLVEVDDHRRVVARALALAAPGGRSRPP